MRDSDLSSRICLCPLLPDFDLQFGPFRCTIVPRYVYVLWILPQKGLIVPTKQYERNAPGVSQTPKHADPKVNV